MSSRSSLSAGEPENSIDLSPTSSRPRFSHIFKLCSRSRSRYHLLIPVNFFVVSFRSFRLSVRACKKFHRRKRWSKVGGELLPGKQPFPHGLLRERTPLIEQEFMAASNALIGQLLWWPANVARPL